MVVTDLSINVIRGNRQLRTAIKDKLSVSDVTMWKLLRENKPNNKLTTVGVVNLIKEHCGLTDEQILITENVEA